MTTELIERLRAIARTPILMIACDYDGTLAELKALLPPATIEYE